MMVQREVLALTVEVFWKYIDTIDQDLLEAGEAEGALRPLVDHLARCNEDELDAFDERLAKLLYALDTKAHADESGDSGPSSDGFLYTRCYVVGKGRAYYEQVLKEPSQFPKSLDQCLEPLLYVTHTAWQKATGEDREYFPSVNYETCSNTDGWPD